MEINVLIDEGLAGYLAESWLQTVVEKILVAQGIDLRAELGLVITGPEIIRQLNQQYRGEDQPTDVLAFALRPPSPSADLTPFVAPPDGIEHLGEVIISYPQAVIQAEEHQHSVKREIAILLIHGILHLLGYDHDKAEVKRRMRAREAKILKYIED